jgi:glycosyltransferase involved in cell wall biosynthesis
METTDVNRAHRILHVIPTLGSGGAERVLLTYLSQPALKQGFQHLVVLTDVADPHSDSPETFLVKLLEEQGVEVVGLGLPGSRNVFKSIIALKRLICERKIDLVHTQLLWANIAGRLAGRWAGVHVLSSFQNTDYDPQYIDSIKASYRKQNLIRILDSWTTRYCVTKSVAVSDYVAKHIESKLGLNQMAIQVIHNCADSTQITPSVSDPRRKIYLELNLGEDAQLILNVGRVTDQKCHIELVEAFSRIAIQHPNALLVVIGSKADKQYLDRLEEVIKSKNLPGRILLIGPRRDIPDWLSVCDLFVFPSKFEGLPVALSEALAAGMACIATNVGAIPELIRHEQTGLLVSLGDIEALAQSITRLLKDKELRQKYGNAARADVLERLHPEIKSRQMAELYKQYSK